MAKDDAHGQGHGGPHQDAITPEGNRNIASEPVGTLAVLWPADPLTVGQSFTLSAAGWQPGIAIPYVVDSTGAGGWSGVSMVIDENGNGSETHIATYAGSYTFRTDYDELILPGHNAAPVTFEVVE